ncbi:MAG: thioesterase family protein [Enterobacterales bacterium]|nr:thioesterase family protein [Enterobacterales bacterium]
MAASEKRQQMLAKMAEVFSNSVPFHNVIGLKFDHLTTEGCQISFDNKPELIGNFVQNILHGGVTATALDVVGGAMAAVAMMQKYPDADELELAQKLARIGTIDLRVDYVRPGRGESFYAKARLLRSGSKVSVVRMELHDNKDTLIALGTGTYMMG